MDTQYDLKCYHRRLKLQTLYADQPDTTPPPFTPSSNWIPPDKKLPGELLNLIQRDMISFNKHFKPRPESSNLTWDEQNALRELKTNTDLIIKPADKGSCVVVMDKTQYLWEGHRQLSDTKYYKKLKKPIFYDTIPMVKKITQSLYQKKFINAKQRSYLIGNSEPRARVFYMLPKIHKNAANWSRPHEIPPGRPIVSDCGSETYFTAEYIDFFLTPLSTRHESYIKDTYHFVEKIRNLTIPQHSLLFTMDVDSLYTNIDTKHGLQTIKNVLKKYPDTNRPDKELMELLEINLTRNDFQFNGEFFLQTRGTAMGRKFAPAYASLYLVEWESTVLALCPKKPLHYFRYLDDIWGVWTHSIDEFDHFFKRLNTHDPSITLKYELNPSSINFLDTTTYKGPEFHSTGRLDTKVFFKETDTHALLHKRSFHPKHTFAGLIKSQILRFDRICTRQEDFMSATKTLFQALRRREYSRSFLRKIFRSFRERRAQATMTKIPLVITYSTATMKLAKTIKSSFHEFSTTHHILDDCQVITAYRRNKNLRDLLIRAQLKPAKPHNPRAQDGYFRRMNYIFNKNTNEIFSTYGQGTPDTKNCVYLILCETCNIYYVGETGNTIRVRMAQHKHNILRRKETNTHFVQHFLTHTWEAVRLTVLEANPNWSTAQRKRAEKLWIAKLDTRFPVGLNMRLVG